MTSKDIYTSPMCSCVFCKKLTSSKGIHSHYYANHGTDSEREKQRPGSKHGSYGVTKQTIEKDNRIKLYNQNPTLCNHCGAPLEYKKRKYDFCNSSCAAKFNNPKKPSRSDDSRQKTSSKIKQYIQMVYDSGIHSPLFDNKPEKHRYSKVSFCQICGSTIKHSNTRKTCSAKCLSKYLSIKSFERLSNQSYRQQHNYGRQKISYLEQSFIDWLNLHGIYYLHEPAFKNWMLKRTYFPDFYFPQFKLIIELDGTQHQKTIKQDQSRDSYIKSTYNIDVIRITHKEYKAKSRLEEICRKLNIS